MGDHQVLFKYINQLIKQPGAKGRHNLIIPLKRRYASMRDLNINGSKLIPNSSFCPRRVGIIPYTIRRGGPYFCLGIDRRYGSLTDFGGGFKKTDITPVKGALREFSEETLGSFGDITNNIDSSLAVFDRAMLIIFVKVDCNPFQINT